MFLLVFVFLEFLLSYLINLERNFFFLQGNLIVIIVAIRKQNYKYVTNCYIINLALTDLLFWLISVPLTAYLGLTNKWILSGVVSCRVHIYLAHVSFILSKELIDNCVVKVLLQTTCYTLAAMSIDRYFYVISSHPRPRWRTPFKAVIIRAIICSGKELKKIFQMKIISMKD